MDSRLAGSSVHGGFQARVLEWVASAFSVIYISDTQTSILKLFLESQAHISKFFYEHFYLGISQDSYQIQHAIK